MTQQFLSRTEASAYLLATYGSPGAVTPKTLAKLAVQGGGPVMHHIGRRVGYKPVDLDAWATSRCSGPRKSTSDQGGGQ